MRQIYLPIELTIPAGNWTAINEDEGEWYSEMVRYLVPLAAEYGLTLDDTYDTDGAYGDTKWTDEDGDEWYGSIGQESEYAARRDSTVSVRYTITKR